MNSTSGYLLTNGKPKVAVYEQGRSMIIGIGNFGTKEACKSLFRFKERKIH